MVERRCIAETDYRPAGCIKAESNTVGGVVEFYRADLYLSDPPGITSLEGFEFYSCWNLVLGRREVFSVAVAGEEFLQQRETSGWCVDSYFGKWVI